MWLHLSGEKETIFPRRQHWTSSVIPACWCISGFFFWQGQPIPGVMNIRGFVYLPLSQKRFIFLHLRVGVSESAAEELQLFLLLWGASARRGSSQDPGHCGSQDQKGRQHGCTARFYSALQWVFSALARKRSSFTTTVEGSGPPVSVTDV